MTMKPLLEAHHVSVSIRRSVPDVYRFASEPRNLPRWASGLGGAIRNESGEWIAEGPLGTVQMRFAAPNELGVLDHEVVLPTGEVVHNPMRVVPNGTGSEVVFTLFRQPGVTDEKLAEDREWIRKDLQALKELLER